MSSHNPTSVYAWPPSIVGFDMPSPAVAGHEGAESVMVAFLSGPPDHYWIEAFVSEVDDFKLQNNLIGVRIDTRRLVVTAPAVQLRGMAFYVRNFVHRVSRLSLQKRVIERLKTEGICATKATEDTAATHDVDLVTRMPRVTAILEEVSRVTGMRFATVARVSDTRWTACAVLDSIDFGLRAGQDLVLETTICNEIRTHGQTVTFDHASTHPLYSKHPTPALYGFESYISVPIYQANGQLFGTLCAVDPQPRTLDQATIQLVEKLAKTIGAEIDKITS